ncbi:MAG TPA: glucose-6-phosphate isomerase, partial [Erythrobacter sp.]|nr:glucose-6-phosphate isomerase [Erythrobacter sp.]
MTTAAQLWTRLETLPRPTLGELFSAARDGGEGADEPGGADRVAMLSGRIELEEGGILFDWSKTHLDRAVVAGFEELAEAMDFA